MVSEQPMITFASHQARVGMTGASEDFEQMLGLLVRATSGQGNLVFANPGDWGIDVLVGDLNGQVTVWQAKYFTRGVDDSQQKQIRGSFASALGTAATQGYTLRRWVLCIPTSMDGPATKWWQGWKARQEQDSGVRIDLWDETRLRELLLRPEAADVRRHYYNPYLRDGQPGGPARAPAPDRPSTPGTAGGAHGWRGGMGRRRALGTIGAGIAAAAAGTIAVARLSSGTGRTPTSPATERAPAWVTPAGDSIVSTPTVSEGVLYTGTVAGDVHAMDARTGEVRWICHTGPSKVYSRPAVVGGTVYVGVDSRSGVLAIDAATGQDIRWTFPTGDGVVSGIVVAADTVYFSCIDYKVYAVEAETGKLRWEYRTEGALQSTPAVVGNRLYVGGGDSYVYALDVDDGGKVWSRLTGGPFLSSPLVAAGKVYIGSHDQNVYAMDAQDGTIDWTYNTGGWIFFSSPAISDDTVYIGSTDHKIFALAADKGGKRWVRTLGGEIQGSPTISNGIVYIGSLDKKLYALDAASGNVRWTCTTGGDIAGSPTVANGLVYVGSDDGNVYAFRT